MRCYWLMTCLVLACGPDTHPGPMGGTLPDPPDGGTGLHGFCTAPRLDCGEQCVDVGNDPANCGACGHACAAGQPCAGGACGATTSACPPGYVHCTSDDECRDVSSDPEQDRKSVV